MSELTWTIGSAAASALLAAGIALVIGALATAWLLRDAATPAAMTRLARFGIGGGAAVFAAAAVRTVLQSAALAETPSAFATMLQPVLFETELGVALRLQAVAAITALVGFGIAPRARRVGYALTMLAATALTIAPGLGGHPAAHEQPGLALSVSVLHVAGLSLWLGTLAALTGTARSLDDATLARAITRFHGLAAFGLAAVVLSGIAKLVDLRPPLGPTLATTWGLALLAKLVLFACVAMLGWWHWRRADAALSEGRRRDVLRSFASELTLASLVLVATGVLVNSMPPERSVDAGPPSNPDAVATRMYREIASPYCPGMSLTSCPSEGAFRLKRRIRARLDSIGRDSVMAELAAEFGPEISGVTPTRGFGLLAWLTPFVGLLLGAVGIAAWTRRSTRRTTRLAMHETTEAATAPAAPLSDDDELARLAEALRADS